MRGHLQGGSRRLNAHWQSGRRRPIVVASGDLRYTMIAEALQTLWTSGKIQIPIFEGKKSAFYTSAIAGSLAPTYPLRIYPVQHYISVQYSAEVREIATGNITYLTGVASWLEDTAGRCDLSTQTTASAVGTAYINAGASRRITLTIPYTLSKHYDGRDSGQPYPNALMLDAVSYTATPAAGYDIVRLDIEQYLAEGYFGSLTVNGNGYLFAANWIGAIIEQTQPQQGGRVPYVIIKE